MTKSQLIVSISPISNIYIIDGMDWFINKVKAIIFLSDIEGAASYISIIKRYLVIVFN